MAVFSIFRGSRALPYLAATAALYAGLASAAPIELVTNGGFETGDLTGWSTNGFPVGGPCPVSDRNWNVSSVGTATGCTPVANPVSGKYAAYVMNDGTGPLTYTLSQTIFDPFGTQNGTFSFDWATANGFDTGRTLSVTLDGTTIFNSSTFGGHSWTLANADVSAILAADAGKSITLQFANYIPRTWTGPAGLGIDNVSIQADVPEPASMALLGLGLLGVAASRRRKKV